MSELQFAIFVWLLKMLGYAFVAFVVLYLGIYLLARALDASEWAKRARRRRRERLK